MFHICLIQILFAGRESALAMNDDDLLFPIEDIGEKKRPQQIKIQEPVRIPTREEEFYGIINANDLDPLKSTTKYKVNRLGAVEIDQILRKLNYLVEGGGEKEVLKLLDIYKMLVGYPKGLAVIKLLANEKNSIAQFILKQSQENKENKNDF